MNSNPATLWKRLALVVCAPIVFVVAVEALLRAADYGFPTGFLIPYSIGGKPMQVDNQFFGYRFFPRAITRTPAPIRLPRAKPAGTVRVFVLGESAAMGEPVPEYGMPRLLGFLLESRCPGTTFEVANAAMTAINSHVITDIARDIAKAQPDLVVLYIGNNEVIGPYGPGTVFHGFSRSRFVTQLAVRFSRLRLAQALKQLAGAARADSALPEWKGLEMFAQRPLPATDARLETVYEQYRLNLEDILGICRRAGADVIVCTVAVNLRDCPPFCAAPAAESGTTWQALFDEGARAQEAGRTAEALAAYGKAAALDDSQAVLVFRTAQCLEAVGRLREAAILYAKARDKDTLRFRADSRQNDILRLVASRGDGHIRLLDAEALFRESSASRVPGGEYFLDHVHFNFRGNVLLAAAVAESAAALPCLRGARRGPLLTVDQCADRAMYTLWDELDITAMMIEQKQKPPFSTQLGNADRIAALKAKQRDLEERAQHDDLDQLRMRYVDAVRARPDDWTYPAGWGEILYTTDRYDESVAALQRALALVPHRYDLRGALAMAFGFLGKPAEGIRVMYGNDRKTGAFPAQFLVKAAGTLARCGKLPEALAFVDEAARSEPDNAGIRQELAARYAAAGRLPEAERELRASLSLQRDNPSAAEDLAVMLTLSGNWNEALSLFQKTLAAHPDRSETRLKYAVALNYRGDFAQAEALLQALIRERPDDSQARFNLGLAYARRSLWTNAIAQFEAALRIEPDATDFQAALEHAREKAAEKPIPFLNGFEAQSP